jgi:hypothetical protein
MRLCAEWQQSCYGSDKILNSKHETRNSKQFQIFEKPIIKPFLLGTFEHLNFGFVSDFDIRILSFQYSYVVPAQLH